MTAIVLTGVPYRPNEKVRWWEGFGTVNVTLKYTPRGDVIAMQESDHEQRVDGKIGNRT
jgi:hypothetical protein